VPLFLDGVHAFVGAEFDVHFLDPHFRFQLFFSGLVFLDLCECAHIKELLDPDSWYRIEKLFSFGSTVAVLKLKV
jgi:hypothetical protein